MEQWFTISAAVFDNFCKNFDFSFPLRIVVRARKDIMKGEEISVQGPML
jgi:hypothetical protein